MPALRLQHYNVVTHDLPATARFYGDLLGLRVGPLPGGHPEDGAWIYDAQGVAVVHVQAAVPGDPRGQAARAAERLGPLARPVDRDSKGTNAIEHVAFECDGHTEMVARLEAAGLAHTGRDIPAAGLRQVFVEDPNGILVELNFAA